MERVLFVCTGNTCRSPIAQAILNDIAPHIEAKSAGIGALPGMELSEGAKKVLEERQLSIQHKATPVDNDLMEWASLILTMTTRHRDVLLDYFPNMKEKVHSLHEYAEQLDGDVHDPFGGDLETYRQTANELERLIEHVVKRLEN